MKIVVIDEVMEVGSLGLVLPFTLVMLQLEVVFVWNFSQKVDGNPVQ
jgi:hypothetical protein